jgi:hypothetical protein
MNNTDRCRIRKKLAKDHVCYVLITCEEPTDGGDMHVEMTYEGDATLASYLLQGAQTFIEEQEVEKEGTCCQSKIHSLHS